MGDSSYEERIIQAALRLVDSGDDVQMSTEAIREIVVCARGMKSRRRANNEGALEFQRRRESLRVVPPLADQAESRVEYDEEKPR